MYDQNKVTVIWKPVEVQSDHEMLRDLILPYGLLANVVVFLV